MKTLKKSLIALFTVAVLFACNEDDLVLPVSDGVNQLEEDAEAGNGPSDGDQGQAFENVSTSSGSALDENDIYEEYEEYEEQILVKDSVIVGPCGQGGRFSAPCNPHQD